MITETCVDRPPRHVHHEVTSREVKPKINAVPLKMLKGSCMPEDLMVKFALGHGRFNGGYT